MNTDQGRREYDATDREQSIESIDDGLKCEDVMMTMTGLGI